MRLLNRVLKTFGIPFYLFRYQLRGVEFLAKNGNKLLLDEMGLGKTIQALSYLQYKKKKWVLIISPSIVKYNWASEAFKWTDYNIVILEGRKASYNQLINSHIYRFNENIKHCVFIINYDIVDYWEDVICKHIDLKCFIIDECQYLMTPTTKRTKAIISLIKWFSKAKSILMSGTPIRNRPREFFTALNICAPSLFPNRFKFYLKYCGAKKTFWGWNFDGKSNIKELHEKIKPFTLRRLRKDVLSQLPDKLRTYFPITITNYTDYLKAEADFKLWIEEQTKNDKPFKNYKATALTKLTALKKLVALGKINSVVEWAKNLIINERKKLIIFAWHTDVIAELVKKIPNNKSLTGKDSANKKFEKANEFQTSDKIKCLIVQIKAGGVGINLTASHNAGVVEFPWSPGDLIQAEDRLLRIGQKNNVNITYFYGMNTIDDSIILTLKNKLDTISQLLDDKTIQERDDLRDIILKKFL